MTYTPDDERISAYLDGELPRDERERFEGELAEREDLRVLVEELRGVRASLQELPRHRLPADYSQWVLLRAELAQHASNGPAAAAPASAATATGATATGAMATVAATSTSADAAVPPPVSPRNTALPWRSLLWSAAAVAAAVLIYVQTRPPDGDDRNQRVALGEKVAPSQKQSIGNAASDNAANAAPSQDDDFRATRFGAVASPMDGHRGQAAPAESVPQAEHDAAEFGSAARFQKLGPGLEHFAEGEALGGGTGALVKGEKLAMPAAPEHRRGGASPADQQFGSPRGIANGASPGGEFHFHADDAVESPLVVTLQITASAARQGAFHRLLAEQQIAVEVPHEAEWTKDAASSQGARGTTDEKASAGQPVGGRGVRELVDSAKDSPALEKENSNSRPRDDRPGSRVESGLSMQLRQAEPPMASTGDSEVFEVSADADQVAAVVRELQRRPAEFAKIQVFSAEMTGGRRKGSGMSLGGRSPAKAESEPSLARRDAGLQRRYDGQSRGDRAVPGNDVQMDKKRLGEGGAPSSELAQLDRQPVNGKQFPPPSAAGKAPDKESPLAKETPSVRDAFPAKATPAEKSVTVPSHIEDGVTSLERGPARSGRPAVPQPKFAAPHPPAPRPEPPAPKRVEDRSARPGQFHDDSGKPMDSLRRQPDQAADNQPVREELHQQDKRFLETKQKPGAVETERRMDRQNASPPAIARRMLDVPQTAVPPAAPALPADKTRAATPSDRAARGSLPRGQLDDADSRRHEPAGEPGAEKLGKQLAAGRPMRALFVLQIIPDAPAAATSPILPGSKP